MQPMPDYTLSVIEQLKSLTVSGSLQVDSAQMDVAKHLDHVLSILKQRRPAAKSSALGFSLRKSRRPQPPRASTSMAASGAAKPC
jgi:cell division protein ZapE